MLTTRRISQHDAGRDSLLSQSVGTTSSTSTSTDSLLSSVSYTSAQSGWSVVWSRSAPNRFQVFFYNAIMPWFVIATAAAFAWYLDMPFIFPSLGPTAFLHFAVPDKPASCPKNTILAHLIGILAGSASLRSTGLNWSPNAFGEEGVSVNRIWCAAMSVGLTCSLMVLFRVPHPPSGATTLIVSLGILKTPLELSVMMAAVILITVEAFIINRIFRTDVVMPIWGVPPPNIMPPPTPKDSLDKLNELNDGLARMGPSQHSRGRYYGDPNKQPFVDGNHSLNGSNYASLPDPSTDKDKVQSLDKKMEYLTVDNWVECYQMCKEIGAEEPMDRLVEFAINNHDALAQKVDYNRDVSYEVRALVDRFAKPRKSRMQSMETGNGSPYTGDNSPYTNYTNSI
eukprot:189102_1